MENEMNAVASEPANDVLGDTERRMKELDIKWGIEYGILRDALDEVIKERDAYKEALERLGRLILERNAGCRVRVEMEG